MKTFANHKYAFGEIVVDPKASSLTQNGQTKRLEPKVISLLSFFVSQPNQVISRQELIDALWSDVVVGDETITRAIFSLRNALGDNPKQPKYIETIPKKGYRFLASAKLFEEKPQATKNKLPLIIATTLIFVTLLSLTFWQEDKPSTDIQQILPFTHMKGTEYDISLDTSEQVAVFGHKYGENNRLVIKNIKTGNIQILAEDSWKKRSPKLLDKDTVVYVRCNQVQCQIARQHKAQAPEVIYETTNTINHFELIKQETPLIIISEYQNNASTELISLSLLNGKVEPLRNRIATLPKHNIFPTYLNEHNILFSVEIKAQIPTIHAFDFSSGKHLYSINGFNEVSSLSVGLNNNQLLVSGTRSDTRGIWLQNTSDHTDAELLMRNSGAEIMLSAVANKKDNSIYYANYLRNYDITQISLTGIKDELTELNSEALELFAQFSNDDKKIYFISNRSGYHEIWMYDFKDAKTKQITHLQTSIMDAPILSNNGRFAAITYKKEELILAIVDIETGTLISSSVIPNLKFPLVWSLNDEYIYASEHLKNINLFKYDRKTLTQKSVRNSTGLFAQEIDDGRSLITFDYQQGAFVTLDLQENTQQQIPKAITQEITGSEYLGPRQVYLREGSIIIVKTKEDKTEIIKYPFLQENELQAPVLITSKPEKRLIFDLSSDTKNLLVHTSKPDRGDIMKMILK